MSLLRFSGLLPLRRHLDARRAEGKSVGVVPTMGALHEGHLSLVREVRKQSDIVVVTIFVNPTQFGPGEDLDRYPRTLERDAELVEQAGADLVFAPSVEEMYPPDEQTRVSVSGVSEGLCGAHRPGHFVGVATVVAKLFCAVGAGTYIFGRKDYQQLRVIEKMARDLLFPVRVISSAIVRDEDGLALSSRNAYLNSEERKLAPALFRALSAAKLAYEEGERRPKNLVERARDTIRGAATPTLGFEIEYLELRDAESLSSEIADDKGLVSPVERPVVLLVAARLGTTRLIDNVEL